MLDPIVTGEVTNPPFPPAPAAAVSDRVSSQAGLASIRGGLTHAEWARERLLQAEAAGEIVKLTGRRSITNPGNDAA